LSNKSAQWPRLRRFNDEGIDFAFGSNAVYLANDDKRPLNLKMLAGETVTYAPEGNDSEGQKMVRHDRIRLMAGAVAMLCKGLQSMPENRLRIADEQRYFLGLSSQ
jgi:hypothetical protein